MQSTATTSLLDINYGFDHRLRPGIMKLITTDHNFIGYWNNLLNSDF